MAANAVLDRAFGKHGKCNHASIQNRFSWPKMLQFFIVLEPEAIRLSIASGTIKFVTLAF